MADDLILPIGADPKQFDAASRRVLEGLDRMETRFQTAPAAAARHFDQAGQKIGRAGYQIVDGFADLNRAGANVGVVMARMSLDVADLAEGVGRMVGKNLAMVAGWAGLAAAAPVLGQALADLAADWLGVAAAGDQAHAAIAASAKQAEQTKDQNERGRLVLAALVKEYESWDHAVQALLSTRRKELSLLGETFGNLGNVEQAFHKMVAAAKEGEVTLGGAMVVVGDVADELSRRAEAASKRAEKAAASALKAISLAQAQAGRAGFFPTAAAEEEELGPAAGRMFEVEFGFAPEPAQLDAMRSSIDLIQQRSAVELDVLSTRATAQAHLVTLNDELAASEGRVQQASERGFTFRGREIRQRQARQAALVAENLAMRQAVFGAIALGIAEGQGAAAIARSVGHMALLRAAEQVAMGFAAAASPFTAAMAPGHFLAAAKWGAVAVLAGFASAALGGGRGGGGAGAATPAGVGPTAQGRLGAPSTGASGGGGTTTIILNIDVAPGAEAAAGEAIVRRIQSYESERNVRVLQRGGI